MFQEFKHDANRLTSYGNYIYQLIDSDFTVETILFDGFYISTICDEYSRRHLPIAPNMARFYRWHVGWGLDIGRRVEGDKNWLDRRYPQWKYGADIYPCVLNQIKMLEYGKRKH